MNKILFFLEKATNRIAIYGSLTALFDEESALIAKAKGTFYNQKLLELEDYEDAVCIIGERIINRKKQNFL